VITIRHQTTGSVRGLWLLDENALGNVDSLIDEYEVDATKANKHDVDLAFHQRKRDLERSPHYAQLSDADKAAQDKELKEETRSRHPYDQDERTVEVTFNSGKRARASRFAELIGDPHIADETPHTFVVRCRKGKHEATMKLSRLFGTSSIDISATPEDTPGAEVAFERVKAWAEATTQGWWPQIWAGGLAFLSYVIAFAIMAISWLIYTATQSTYISSSNNELSAEGRRLIDGGLKPEDERKAIEILLALHTGYRPPQTKYDPLFPSWWIVLCATMLVLCFLLSCSPTTMIALGKGRRLVPRIHRRLGLVNWLLVTVVVGGIGVAAIVKVVFSSVGW
jgi:hypothetical protein